MDRSSLAGAEQAAWRALLRRGDIKLAAFLDRGPPGDLEVLFASRSFLRLADLPPDREVRGRSLTALLAATPDCLEMLRGYRPSLAGNSAIEWDCNWPGDSSRDVHRCVMTPFRADDLRGCLLAVDDGLPASLPVLAAPERAQTGSARHPDGGARGAVRHGSAAADAAPEARAPEVSTPKALAAATARAATRQAAAGRAATGPGAMGPLGATGPGALGPRGALGWAAAAGWRQAASPAPAHCGRTSWPAAAAPSLFDGAADRIGGGFGRQAHEPAGFFGAAGPACDGPVPPGAVPPLDRPADAMEPEFWQAFVQIAEECGVPVDQLWREAAGDAGNRDVRSAVRTFVLRYFQVQGLNHAT